MQEPLIDSSANMTLQAACRLIVERFYEEQQATSDEDLGVFILLVPTAHAVAMSEDGILHANSSRAFLLHGYPRTLRSTE